MIGIAEAVNSQMECPMSNKKNFADEVKQVIAAAVPAPLTLGEGFQPDEDHAAGAVKLTLAGQTHVAADHFLFPELAEVAAEIIGESIRRLNLALAGATITDSDNGETRSKKILTWFYTYDFLLELALNYVGLESREIHDHSKTQALDYISNMLEYMEEVECEQHGESFIAAATVLRILEKMKLVQGGVSMVARAAGRIEKALAEDEGDFVTIAFLSAAEDEILDNIYTQMITAGVCRFGNDYALGLRWLRHLGFEQVSTNPVLAAKAYADDPSLKGEFIRAAKCHPKYAEWKKNPAKAGDEITLFATLTALWDNLHVYRPVFYNLAEESGGGVVSFQLNPNLAHLADESIADALDALAQAESDLRIYDEYLLAGFPNYTDKGRANMVIKVAAAHPAAMDIAAAINSFGLGSNITVIYTVAQEATMIIEEMRGMARAIRRGIVPTQLYMTNMGGRLESHLREVFLEAAFAKLAKKSGESAALSAVEKLAVANGSVAAVNGASSFAEKVIAVTRFGVQKTIDHNITTALAGLYTADELTAWEDAIGKSGTLVARRVWSLFFSDKNRARWMAFMCEEFEIDEEQAEFILSRINVLPASKRKPHDTYWTLSSTNMVHTEFGNHQENVRVMADDEEFIISDYVESIRDAFPQQVTDMLMQIPDFVTAYELSEDLAQLAEALGIKDDLGARGHTPEQWGEFGSVKKTITEFKAAYSEFRDYIVAAFAEA